MDPSPDTGSARDMRPSRRAEPREEENMIATPQDERTHRRRALETASTCKARRRFAHAPGRKSAPIVAAVEPRTARMTADTAARIARELGAPLVFVTVRPPVPAGPGEPYHERRSLRDLFRSRKTLDVALATASRHGVTSYGEIVEGEAATEIAAFARARQARLLVIGRVVAAAAGEAARETS
jgi:nucleotide-binding universal stress UspA family protein